MLEKEKKLIIEKIQNSDLDICINLSGCGFQFLDNVLRISGASKFLLNAEIPYSKSILENFIKKNFSIFFVLDILGIFFDCINRFIYHEH